MTGAKRKKVTTLYQVLDGDGMASLRALHFRKFPACAEPAFYPVLNKHFALEALRQRTGTCYLTHFNICATYVRNFEVQTLSGEVHEELWIPAEELSVFNEKIVGKISLVKAQ